MRNQSSARFLQVLRTGGILFILLFSTFAIPQSASAAIPAGYSEYYIPGGTDQLFQILKDIDNDPDLGNALGGGGTCTAAPCNMMHNVTTVSVSADNVTVYYDHWENGYGTGSTGNDETYVVNKGDVLTFESSNIPVPRNAADTCTSTNPNGASTACYDGRDRIYVAGGAVSVAQAFWPEVTQTVFANAWEVYPVKPYQISYTIPVGENLSGAPLNYTDFTQVFVIVQATQDNTNIQIDNPGVAGVDVNVTLNRGEVTQLFHIDSETTVLATAPVQTQFIVGQPYAGISSDSRSYTAVPSGLWSSSYYGPVPGFGGGYNTDVFIYNPTGTDLTINYEDNVGNGSFVVPANATRSYQDLAGRYVPTNSALYLEAANGTTNFWAIGSVDTEDPDFNYGFTFIPPTELTDEYFISWAPGTTDLSDNGSPVFVTPTTDNTTIFVDYSPTDGVVDATYTLNRIQMQRIFDPDNNNTGMHVWASGPIAVVWGEDANAAAPGNPYIDAGYTILPLNVQWLDVVVTLDKTADPAVIPSGPGQVSVFTLVINSDAFGLDSVTVSDLLPASWAYVAGSTTITLPGGSTITGAPADPTVSGQNLTWDSFPTGPLNMNPNETLIIEFSGITTGTPADGFSINEGTVTGTRGGETFTSSDTATVEVSQLEIEKLSSAGGTTAPGDTITYTINVTNTGEPTHNNIVVNDPLPIGTTYVANSTVVTSGGVTMDNIPGGANPDLIDGTPPNLVLAGDNFDLLGGASMTVTFQVIVDAPPPAGQTDVTNTVSVSSAEQPDPLQASVVDTLEYADLSLTKIVDNATPQYLSDVTFTIEVTNSGPSVATNVAVGDQLPAGFTYVGAVPSQGTYNDVTNVWSVGTLAVNASASLALTATVNPTGPYTNYAQVTASDQYDPDSTPNDNSTNQDDDDTAVVRPAQEQPGISKTVDVSQATIGEIVTYEVQVVVPTGVFVNTQMVDTMQRGLAFVGCTNIDAPGLTTSIAAGFPAICSNTTTDDAGGGTPMDIDRRVTYDFGTLTNEGQQDVTVTITYQAIVLDIAANNDGDTLQNSVLWTWDGGELGPVQTTITIVEPELAIEKSSDTNTIEDGSEVLLNLVISHTANSHADAYDVVLTDVLPVGMTYVPNSLDCSLGAQDPDVECVFDDTDPTTPTIRAAWSVFTRNGGVGRVQFRVVGNEFLPASGTITNLGHVDWSSLEGDQTVPRSFSAPPNPFATERYYDPPDQINLYGADDTLTLNLPGGGGGGGGRQTGGGGGGVAGLIPVTGFAPDRVTDLSGLQVTRYNLLTDVTLEIPVLKLTLPIVGIPKANNTWDVNWLLHQAGWLDGSAFPGYSGNSVLTSHVTLSYGQPGPFANLHKLNVGDKIFVHAFGELYIYEVRSSKKLDATDPSILQHEDESWLTLVTCADYSEDAATYLKRLVVKAEFLQAQPDY